MYSRQPPLTATLTLLAVLATLLGAACSANIDTNGQLAGQFCRSDDDCADDLICSQRVCVPTSIIHADGSSGGNPDALGGLDGGVEPDTTPSTPDTDPTPDVKIPDVSQGCGEAGRTECLDNMTRRVCQEGGDWRQEACTDTQVCIEGACQLRRIACSDRDGDGYWARCPVDEMDCDDTDPNVNPGAREVCNNNFDDNCNGQRDENCQACCPNGCGDGEFCDGCTCKPYQPQTCQTQNQPCSTSGRDNGFVCTDQLSGKQRCVGLCELDADSPDATCPTADTSCVFEADRRSNTGLCFSNCKLNQGCGLPDMGCMPYDGRNGVEGVCVPANNRNQIGSSCESGSIFDCESGALCVGGGRGEPGTCRQACRPFGNASGTDCNAGSKCLPISDTVGICTPDNGKKQGDRCQENNTTCGSDAVGCFGQGSSGRCYRTCRIEKGNADCKAETARCQRVGGGNGDLGICRN